MLDSLAFPADQSPEQPRRGEVWLREAGTRDAELVFSFPDRRGAQRRGEAAARALVRLAPQALAGAGRPAQRPRGHLDPRPLPPARSRARTCSPGSATRASGAAWCRSPRATGRASSWSARCRATGPRSSTERGGPTPASTCCRSTPSQRRRLGDAEGAQLDDLARDALEEIRAGRTPAAATLDLELDEQNEPQLALLPGWDLSPVEDFRKLPESRPFERAGRFFDRGRSWKFAVPADPALAEALQAFVDEHPVGRPRAGGPRAAGRAAGRARARVGHRGALVRRGRRAGRGARRRAAPLPARRRALRAGAPAHLHRRRAGPRQDRAGAGHARGRRCLPGRGGLPRVDEAHVGARGPHLAAGAQRGAARAGAGASGRPRPWRPRSSC